ncbi:MAG TPA: hypothetical protein DC017_18380, partial [Candidatus Wallbacteria bacterium]|nr:hypothetical protein [Candidatus Wallbacteria bacterium]
MIRWIAYKIFPPIPEIPDDSQYEAPEIEVENFNISKKVPDLNQIECALYIGDTSKVITLIMLRLVNKKAVS